MIKLQDLPKWAQDLAEDNRARVKQQQEALDVVEGPIRALAEHKDKEKLSVAEVRQITTVLRWGPEDYDEFLNPAPITNESEIVMGNGEKKMHTSVTEPVALEDRVERTFAPPHYFFYVEVDGTLYQVYTESGKAVEIRDENHPDF